MYSRVSEAKLANPCRDQVMTSFLTKNHTRPRPMKNKARPESIEIVKLRSRPLARKYTRYVGAAKVNSPATITSTSLKYFDSILLTDGFAFSASVKVEAPNDCLNVHALSYNPSFTSLPRAFIRNLKTEKPAPLSALSPVVDPSKHTPSTLCSLAIPSINPVAPTILPLL